MSQYAIYESMQDDCADILTGPCPFCGQQGWITVPQPGVDALVAGRPVQAALRELDHRLREQIISGTHPAASPAPSSVTASTLT